MRCVTSFGREGYDLYGKKFLDTYSEYVNVPIDVYTEDDYSYQEYDCVTYKSLLNVEGCKEYLTLCQFPAAQGHLWGEEKRNYRFDTFRFSRKSFAQIDAASYKPETLFWIDADIEFKKPFKFPEFDGFMCYLGRPEWHSCASFVGWDLTHEMSGEFWKRYWLLHVTGTIFCLPEWHDSFVLDWLRGQTGVPAVNLSEGLELKGPANVFDAVFGEYAHHKKGNLKLVA